MIRLAQDCGKESLSLANIAKDEKISRKYLEQLFSKLKRAKLISAEKGTAGGYKLTRHPSKIDALGIINALEGEMLPFYCLNAGNKIYCNSRCGCGVTLVLNKVQEVIIGTLKNIKLSELAK